MAAKKKVAPTATRSKKAESDARESEIAAAARQRVLDLVGDAVGQIAHDVRIVEALAVGAAEVADSDDPQTCRRLRALVVQIEGAAGDALATAHELDAKINLTGQPL